MAKKKARSRARPIAGLTRVCAPSPQERAFLIAHQLRRLAMRHAELCRQHAERFERLALSPHTTHLHVKDARHELVRAFTPMAKAWLKPKKAK